MTANEVELYLNLLPRL